MKDKQNDKKVWKIKKTISFLREMGACLSQKKWVKHSKGIASKLHNS